MPDLVGKTLKGRYRIDQLLGRGGMAEVYKAWDLRRQYHVAVKVMREDLAEDVEFLDRFRREAQALSTLSHANIVRFYSFEREGRLAFIVMDYVQGSTLRGAILDASGAPLPLAQVASIAQQVCAALNYAHAENVLHRDVKPGNIMIRPDGSVLVTDFGIAKAADAATATTIMPGTPAYMPPEQCRSEPLDARADVYSLGIVLYEMLTGVRPFRGQSTEAGTGSTRERIRWEQVHASPLPLRVLNPSLSSEMEQVVLQSLAKEPEDRWPSALAFWQALEQALRSLGVAVEAVTPLPAMPVGRDPSGALPPICPAVPLALSDQSSLVPIPARIRRGWLLTAGIAAAAVLLVWGVALAFRHEPLPDAGRQAALAIAATVTPSPSAFALTATNMPVPSSSPTATAENTATPTLTSTPTSSPAPTMTASSTPIPTNTPHPTPKPPTATPALTDTPIPPPPPRYLCDEFDGSGLDGSYWQVYANGGRVQVGGSRLSLGAPSGSTQFPYVHAIGNPFPKSSGFRLHIRFQYTQVTYSGTGIVTGSLLPVNTLEYPDESLPQIFYFSVWQDANIGLRLTVGNHPILGTVVHQGGTPDLGLHNVVFECVAGNYGIWIDGWSVYQAPGNPRPGALWLGNHVMLSPGNPDADLNWTGLQVERICIEEVQ